MPAPLTIQLSRGFDAQGVWAPQVLSLPVDDAAATAAPASGRRALPPPAAIPMYLGEVDPSPRSDAPVLVASLKAMAVLVALLGAYLSGLFLLGSPANITRTEHSAAVPAAPLGLMPLVVSVAHPAVAPKR